MRLSIGRYEYEHAIIPLRQSPRTSPLWNTITKHPLECIRNYSIANVSARLKDLYYELCLWLLIGRYVYEHVDAILPWKRNSRTSPLWNTTQST
jgi:hypothetical protein